jgi:hypothetical protein
MKLKTNILVLLSLNCMIVFGQIKHVLQEPMQSEHISKHSLVYNDEVVFDHSETNRNPLSDTVFLQYNRINSHSYISNSQYYFSSLQAVWVSDYFAKLPIIPGTYDILTDMRKTAYDYYILIYEEVELNHGDTLCFFVEDAANEIVLEGIDENGIPFENLSGSANKVFSFIFPENTLLISSSYSLTQNKNLHCNSFSDRFLLYTSNLYYDLYEENKINLVLFDPLYGLNNNVLQQFDISNYYRENLKLYFEKSTETPKLCIFHVREIVLDGVWYLSKVGIQKEVGDAGWEGCFYVSPNQAQNYAHAWLPGVFIEHSSYPYYFGETFDVYNDSVREGFGTQTPNWVMQAENGFFNVGKGAIIPNFIYDNCQISSSQSQIYFGANTNYFGINNEERREDQLFSPYNILDDEGNILENGILGDFEQYTTSREKYKFKVTNNRYYIGNRSGSSEYIAEFDLQNDDASPPSLFRFQTLNSEGLPFEILRKDETAALFFAASDYYWIDESQHWYPLRLKKLITDSTMLFIKHENNPDWEMLDLDYFYQDTINGSYFRTDLSNFTFSDTGFYDVKIRICDSSYNKVSYTLTPAFGVKSEFVGIKDNISTDNNLLFSCFPNPFSDQLKINIKSEKEFPFCFRVYNSQGVLIDEFVSTDKEINWIPSKNIEAGIYFIKVKYFNNSSVLKLVKQK